MRPPEPLAPPTPPDERPPSQEGLSEDGARQLFIWALVAGFIPCLGLPVVWGLTALGWSGSASHTARPWRRRLVALAIVDTLVGAAALHLGAVERGGERREQALASVEASELAPSPVGLFEPGGQGAPVVAPTGVRKEWIGVGLAIGALLALWGLGRRRGANATPLGVLAGLGAAVLGSTATLVGLSSVLGGPTRGGVLLAAWAQTLLLLLAGLLLLRRGAPAPEEQGARGWLRTYFLSLGLLIALGLRTLILLAWLSQLLSVSPEDVQHPLTGLARQGPLGPLGWVLLAVPAVLLAPVGEELVFRGALLPWLRGWMGRTAALVLSAGIFASLHAFYGVLTGWVLFLGLVLGWARLESGGLRAPILLHATINGFALLMLARTLAG